MKISFICSDPLHPVNTYLEDWIGANEGIHEITLARRKSDLPGGDILFLVSCSEIILQSDRSKYVACLVLHASDLPHGRGWSPHVWEIIGGATEITLSLIEADDKVDSGKVWKKLTFSVPKHALWNEINHVLFQAEIALIDHAIRNFKNICPVEQVQDIETNYYRRRVPEDSRINPSESIVSQFDLIRVCDPGRFPAFFELYGQRYKILLEKLE